MLIDLRRRPNGSVIDTDVCIVGAGAAGISMALALRGKPFDVCLVEAGGLDGDRAAQALARGENVGLPYFRLDECRQNGFGGTTSVWAGACRPLDPADLDARGWVPYSGWPISCSDLDRYYPRAQQVCRLGPYAYSVADWDPECRQRLPLPPEHVETRIFQIAPTRFGRVYRHAVLDAPNITTLVHANALEIETSDSGRVATGVRVATLNGKRGQVRARRVVLAMGGMENARLLLLSRRAMPCGLGNQHDAVGRFFAEHLYVNCGELVLNHPRQHASFYSVSHAHLGGRSARIEAVLCVADGLNRREGMLRSAIHFPPRWRTNSAFDSDGAQALAHLFREARLRRVPYNWAGRIGRVLSSLDKMVALGHQRLAEPRGPRSWLAARMFSEQAPNPASRLVLSDERDPLGRQRVRLDWQLMELDFGTLWRSQEVLSETVRQAGVGEFRGSLDREGEWRRRVTGGRHHMGTTRMSASPSSGVVDRDCRVHGVANLYVAGSSVFPNVGYANPTLTIVALALRLADHLTVNAQSDASTEE